MKLKIFTVFDSKVEAYLQPFFIQSRGAAIRSFTEAANEVGHQFNKYPSDFTLFYVGEYDDQNCKFDLFSAPEPCGVAIEYLKHPVSLPFKGGVA